VTPAGNSDLPRPSAATAPASSRRRPRGFIAAIQRLRAACGSSCAVNHVAARHLPAPQRAPSAAPSVIAMAQPAAVAVRAAISLVFMPPFDRPEPASPAIASISGVIASITAMRRAGSCAGWRCRARPHPTAAPDIRPRHHRDLRGQPVIVAIADLVGGDGVVLVHDRHAPSPRSAASVARVFR
jgi:hypothetical protein